MSVWSILLLIGSLMITGFSILVVWACIDVRKRLQKRDAEEILAAEDQAVIGCEGDCNTCPLRNLHVGLRKQIRVAEALGGAAMGEATLGDVKSLLDISTVQPGFARLSLDNSGFRNKQAHS